MGHCRLAVSTPDLRALADRVDGVAERTEQVRSRLRRVSRSQMGSRAVDEALDDFQGHWDWGMDRLSRTVDTASGQLRAAADAFQQVEDELRKALCG